MHLEVKEDADGILPQPTMGTDGRRMIYNIEFIDKLSESEVEGVLCHEVLHVANLHHTRQGDRNPKLWNMAADYVINLTIIEARMHLPKGALINTNYEGKSVEQVYNELYRETNGGENIPQYNNFGAILNFPGEGGSKPTPAQIKRHEANIKTIVGQAIAIAKKRGEIPGNLVRNFEKMYKPKLDWRDLLRQFFTTVSKNDYTFQRPNKRFTQFYMPSLKSTTVGELAFIVDTSGSIGQREFDMVYAEIENGLNTFPGIEILLYGVDTKVASKQRVVSGDINIKLKGGGGTDFRPAFDDILKSGEIPIGAVYFTDGHCDSFPDAPEFPVMWLLTEENESFEPPFGQVVDMG